MKLSKKTWLFLVVSAFVVAFASLGTAYAQQGRVKIQLNQELSLAQMRLTKYPFEDFTAQKTEMEKQMAETALKLTAAKKKLTRSLESIEVTDTIFEAAEACGVEVIEINSTSPTSNSLEEISCIALPLSIEVEGDVSEIINFTVKLNKEFSTGTVESIQVEIPEETDEEEETTEPSATIELFIYSYQGD